MLMAKQEVRELWGLCPGFTFLNHGSYGAVPRHIIEQQHRLHVHIEAQPVRFFAREIEPLMELSRRKLGEFLGADPEGLVFVPNATTGVNTVLRSAGLGPGDEILITDHVYNACNNAVEFVARNTGARVIKVHVPYPIDSPATVADRVLSGVTPRTRIILIDHVTSPTALVFPVGEIIREARSRGIEVLVDGAHAPGMLLWTLSRWEQRTTQAIATSGCAPQRARPSSSSPRKRVLECGPSA